MKHISEAENMYEMEFRLKYNEDTEINFSLKTNDVKELTDFIVKIIDLLAEKTQEEGGIKKLWKIIKELKEIEDISKEKQMEGPINIPYIYRIVAPVDQYGVSWSDSSSNEHENIER